MTVTRAWEQIICDEMSDLARSAVGDVASSIRGLDPAKQSASQLSEIALLLAYMELFNPERGWRDLAISYLDLAIERISGGAEQLAIGLYSGLSGVGWIIQHVIDLLGEYERTVIDGTNENEDDPLRELDAAILRRLERYSWVGRYDLIDGLVGVGIYWLERFPCKSAVRGLHLVLNQLEQTAEKTLPGVAWFTPAEFVPESAREQFPLGYYNLGTAHGIPGIVQFLAQLVSIKFEPDRGWPLLELALEWLLARQRPPGALSYYSSFFMPGQDGGDSRVGWCYGDLGLAATLHQAGRYASKQEWTTAAESILRRCVTRPRAGDGVDDATLCHGAVGVAHIYSRIYQMERDPCYRNAANEFYERALGMRRPGNGVGGFSALAWQEGRGSYWKADTSFLSGAIGVALGLISAISPIPPQWDRLLLLSGQTDRVH